MAVAAQEFCIPDMLASTVDKYPSRTALAYVGGDVFSYAQLQNRVTGLCVILQEAGLKKGDKVAILSENSPQWGMVFLAAATVGAVAVPILTQFHSEAIIHIIRHSEARAVFVSRSLYPKIQEADLKGLALFYTDDFSPVEESSDGGRGLKSAINSGFKGLDRLKQAARKWAGVGQAEKVMSDDLAVIVYTSGTTGNSKGVMLTHKNLLYDAARAGEVVDAGHEDRFLSILPLAHTYECSLGLLAPLIHGSSVYYLREAPTPRILLPAMAKVQPTIVLMVPLIIEKIFKTRILPQLNKNRLMRAAYRVPFVRTRLHRLAGKKLMQSFGGQIKALCIGGAPLAGEAERFLRDAGVPYSVGYGLTETAPLVAGARPSRTRFASTGRALEGVQIRIEHPDPVTGIGEILVKGPIVMQGYFKAPEITSQVLDESGWLTTGDLGRLDRDGYLYIKGRLKNVILGPSGENIYPEEVESVINRSDYVLESLVYSANNMLTARVHLNYEKLDEDFGLKNVAETRVKTMVEEVLNQLKNNVNSQVSEFARLRKMIEQPEPFEKTPTQKIKRYLYTEGE